MPRSPRSEQFSADQLGIVHLVQRCCRRAFLCGKDAYSGRSYEHRRGWIRRRLELLASVFAVDVLSYAVLSNHLHLVLRNRPDVAALWDEREVALRWLRLFPGRRLEEQLAEPTETQVQALLQDRPRLASVRLRLSDPSWFMRSLAEPIARLANREDQCSGRFWEGRFKAQALSDEASLLACSMYVDLNPVRAALAASIQSAEHSSAYDRLRAERGECIESAAGPLVARTNEQAARQRKHTAPEQQRQQRRGRRRGSPLSVPADAWLAPLPLGEALASDPQPSGPVAGQHAVRASDKGFLPLSVRQYLQLLDWVATQRGGVGAAKVPTKLAAVLQRVGIQGEMLADLVWNFQRYFGRSGAAGSPRSLAARAQAAGRRASAGVRQAAACFVS